MTAYYDENDPFAAAQRWARRCCLTYAESERWATVAVDMLRYEGRDRHEVLRMFDTRWCGDDEPGWEDVVSKVAVAYRRAVAVAR